MATATRSATPRATHGIPISPTRISRLQEKEEISRLNDRLAVYIDRVRALELENDRLMVKVSEKEEATTGEVTGLNALYEGELADTRRVLDQTSWERAKLQIDLGTVTAKLEEVTRNFSKRDGDLGLAQARVKDLESLYNKSEAELSTAVIENGALGTELADLKIQLSKAIGAHMVAKKQLEAESLMRVDLENRCQSLSEELQFRKSVFEEEVRETRALHERRKVETDSGRADEYELKLMQALQDMRRQHDQQVALSKEELELTFHAKDKAVSAAREELQETHTRLERLGFQLSTLQKQLVMSPLGRSVGPVRRRKPFCQCCREAREAPHVLRQHAAS